MAAAAEHTIQYRFTFPDGVDVQFRLTLDPATTLIIDPPPPAPAPWTHLTVHQCANCPLDAQYHRHCPAALRFEPVLKAFSAARSYDPVTVTVTVEARTTIHETTVQKGLASLIGLIFPTSGCPRLTPFRPMARFHLPFATLPETLFRATGMYLLSQYFRQMDGGTGDWTMDGLIGIYSQLEAVNMAMSKRLRKASETDSSVNAVILLDMLAKVLPYALEDALDELRPLFSPT